MTTDPTDEASASQEREVVEFDSTDEWAAWLDENQERSGGVWLKIPKRGQAVGDITYSDALDVALCYGWIDGQKAGLDEAFWLQRFTPRRRRSKWSKINVERAERLYAAGLMTPRGIEEIERAKSDGRWDAAYDSQSRAQIPEDLQIELEKNDAARAFFATLNSANRYAIVYRIQDAKKPETRARRISQLVAMLAEGKKLHP